MVFLNDSGQCVGYNNGVGVTWGYPDHAVFGHGPNLISTIQNQPDHGVIGDNYS